jgi:hypothetical protein
MACGHRLAERVPHCRMHWPTNRYQRRARRRLKNFSRNRPETTNLNHQYAIRRVDICRILDAPSGPAWIAPKPETGCDMVHIGGRRRRRDRWGKFALIAESLPRDCATGAPRSAIGSPPPASAGGPALPIAAWLSGHPITHPIAIDIAICAVNALAATATMTDYTGKDISGDQSR